MRIRDVARVALRALTSHRLRTSLNLLGVVIAVTTIIAVISDFLHLKQVGGVTPLS